MAQNDMWKILNEALKNGEVLAGHLPEVYTENERITPPDSAQGQHFQREMERITKKLLPDYPLDTHPIRFLITDRGDYNAYVLPRHKPAIITMDKSILADFKSEDELAYVLGHELTHLKLTHELGSGHNSKGEEYSADLRPLAWMQRAGYDPRQALEYTKRESSRGKKPIDWFRMIDAHGLPDNRVDAVEKALAALDKHMGGLHNPKREMTVELVNTIASAHHLSHMDRVKAACNYDTLEPLAQLEVLRTELPNQKSNYIMRWREMYKAIAKLKLDPTQEEHAKALNRTISTAVDYPDAFNQLFSALARKRFGDIDKAKPVGKLAAISRTVRELMEANNAQDANHAADQLVAQLDAIQSDRLNLHEVKWPNFELPSRRDLKDIFADGDVYTPPWDDLAQWATPGSNIPIALLKMGVPDPRLLELLPKKQLRQYVDGNLSSFTRVKIPGEQYVGVKLNRNGEIYAFSGNTIEQATHSAYAADLSAQKLENRPEENAPIYTNDTTGNVTFISVTPDEFLKNYERYFDENRELLSVPRILQDLNRQVFSHSREDQASIDEMTEQERRFDTHASVLASMFDQMMKEDKEKYRDFVHSFFTGRGDKRDMDHLAPLDSHTSPYTRFVMRDRHDLFTIEEKAKILSNQTLWPSESGDETLDIMRRLLRYEKPKTTKEMGEVLELYNQFNAHQTGMVNVDLEEATEIREFFKLAADQEPPQKIAPLLIAYGDQLNRALEGDSECREALIGLVKKEAMPKGSTNSIAIYKTLENCRAFPSETWRKEWVNKLVSSIRKLKHPKDRISLLEELLLGKSIRDVDLRTQAISMWVEDNLALFGKDTGTPQYHAKHDAAFHALLKRVKENTPFHQRYEMFTTLADAMETQREWSYALRDHLFDRSRESLEKTHLHGIIGDVTLTMISKHETLRKETINFLIKPITSASQSSFAEKVLGADNDQEDTSLWRTDQLIEAKRIYENYWNAPMAVRVVLMDELLVSSQERKADRNNGNGNENYRKAFDYVIDRVLPENMKYAKEARSFLEAYSNVVPSYQRTLLLSSMMVAGERAGRSEDKNFGVGKRLAMILELMGPAERKLGQTVHSHPQTPDDIRTDMERLKSMAAPPARWDLITRYEQVVPEEYRAEIKRIGTLKGAASYFMTLGLEHQDDTTSVMALQRENARAQAKEGFRLLHGLVDELRKTDVELSKIADTVTEMIRQAESMSDIETDADIGNQQVALAQELYNGLHITVDGETFHFSTAPWIAYGAEFRDQKEMHGQHFNDLPEQTEQQQARKKAIATACVTAELLTILKGGVFDHDRHGAQLRIDDANNIGLFDHGAMEIHPPSEEDKQVLARVLFHTLASYQSGTPLSEVLYDQINQIRETTGTSPDYLVRVERGLLALSDFLRYIQPEDVPAILVGIYHTGQIDPTIQQEVANLAMAGEIDISLFDSMAAVSSAVAITQDPTIAPPPPRRFDTQVEISIPDMNAGSSGIMDGKSYDERQAKPPAKPDPDDTTDRTWTKEALKSKLRQPKTKPPLTDATTRGSWGRSAT